MRTGVTAVLPRGYQDDPVFAGWYSLNGCGEMTGTTWVEESGFLQGPLMITNTHSVGVVHDAVIAWRHQPTFDPDDPRSLSDNLVRAIVEDGEGVLWLATQQGLVYLDGDRLRLTHYCVSGTQPELVATRIDADGNEHEVVIVGFEHQPLP